MTVFFMSWMGFLLFVILGCTIGIVNLTIKNEALEEYNQELEAFVLKMQQDTKEILDNITAVDIRGSFKSDDEVGVVFDGIKGMVQRLEVFLEAEG